MTITLDERLRQELEDCPDESTVGPDLMQELIDDAVSGRQLDHAMSELLGFDVVAVDTDIAQPDATEPAVAGPGETIEPPVVSPHEAVDRIDTLPDIIFVIGNDGRILECRGGDSSDLVVPRDELVGKLFAKCPFGGVGQKLEAAMAAARNGEGQVSIEYDMPCGDKLLGFEARLKRSPDGELLAVVRNTSRGPSAGSERASDSAAADTLTMLKATFDATADGVLVVDSAGNFVTANRLFYEMWRIPKHVLHPGRERAVAKFALAQLKNPKAVLLKAVEIHNSSEYRTSHVVQFHNGRFFECVSMPQVIDGRDAGRVWNFRDITDRARAEERIRHNAYHDSLTGLPNRALFQDRLSQEVSRAQRSGTSTALLLLDVDRFKTINDTLGHDAGDKLLTEVASRLKSRRRKGDTIARLGGDEFVFIVSALHHKEDVAVVADQLLDVFKPPIHIDEHELHVSASIGIAIYPDDGESGTTLMKSADVALYRAKELGRNNYQVFEPKLNERAMERLVLEKDLRRALHEDEFVLEYQPQFDLETGEMRGVEALVRWKQGAEVVSPAKFIPIAEECGLIVPLGRWVLEEATARCVEFNRLAEKPLRICVNVSALQIQRPNFANEVSQILQAAGLPPKDLVVELTESALMQNPELGSYAMEQLQQMNVGVAMDDFGTGHSSLGYVSVLPISMVKIDRLFVQNCAKRKADASILSSIVTMGHALGLKVLAEGVETEEQAAILRAHGCDEVQGYLFGRPMPPEQLIALLKKKDN